MAIVPAAAVAMSRFPSRSKSANATLVMPVASPLRERPPAPSPLSNTSSVLQLIRSTFPSESKSPVSKSFDTKEYDGPGECGSFEKRAPPGQVGWQTPETHPSFAAHDTPHAPQWAGLLATSTHDPPQVVAQPVPQAPPVHVTLVAPVDAAQDAQLAPQAATLESTTQMPLQAW